MHRLYFIAFSLLNAILLGGCGKNNSAADEAAFYGTWIKGTAAGDTLRFFKQNGKNMLSYNLSFNAALFVPTEVEYSCTGGKPAIKNYLATPGDFFVIKSFEWQQYGKRFSIQGSELFPFMAATMVRFNYRKVR